MGEPSLRALIFELQLTASMIVPVSSAPWRRAILLLSAIEADVLTSAPTEPAMELFAQR